LSRPRIIFALISCFVISGCSQPSYYLQAVSGQLSLLSKRTAVEKLINNPDTPQDLQQRLIKADEIRRYAVETLELGDNPGFTSYADIGRPYVTWNVVAAPAYSLQPETWCFPIAGCVSYKGYFAKADAEAFEQDLLSEGKDTLVYGVAAYSTLGWFADPLLNTFIHYKNDDLASLIFHELAHQLVYVKDDSDFNEAFATAVEQILLERWLIQQGSEEAVTARSERRRKHNRVTEMVLHYRQQLNNAYAGEHASRDKPRLFEEMRKEYKILQADGQGTRYYDWWFSRPLDNADLLTVSTYYQLVPDFLALYEKNNHNLQQFVEAVKALKSLEKNQRRQALVATAPQD